ncbi:cytosine permease [Gryllotalpicola kribbensis]|uniref:Cytosine permease n=1 Tax=Gryllotalpicola kribbensis TaxID=993084 RepID=A0ABP8AN16_9MICO
MTDIHTHPPRLDDQYEHTPVPPEHRKSTLAIGAAWAGMPMVLTATVIGGQLAYFLGFAQGLLALVIGAAVLAVYVGILSYTAGHTGRNFGQFSRSVFGRVGALVPALLLSTVIVGWYAFQTGLTGSLLSAITGWNAAILAIAAGIVFIFITFVGIRAISWIGYISAPLFIVFGVAALVIGGTAQGWPDIAAYAGASRTAAAWPLGVGVTVVIASLVDAGTMTADFTRFSRTGREAVAATLAAFPVGQFVSAFIGVLVVSAGLAVDPAVNGGMFIGVLLGSPVSQVVVAVFVVLNLAAVCAHCLYNGAMGWSHATGARFRTTTVVLGLIGLFAAGLGVWSLFSDWLTILGVIVPPIGVVIIVSVLVRGYGFLAADAARVRVGAFVAWAIGSAAALLTHLFAPALSDAVVGIVVAAVASLIAERLASPARSAVRTEA